MLRRLSITISVAGMFAALLLGGAGYYGVTRWRSPAAAEVEIPSGASVHGIAEQLALAGVIRQPRLFELLVRLKGAGARMRAGSYEFPAGMTLIGALSKIERGEVRQYPLTVIEGWTAREIARALEEKPFAASSSVPAEFVRAALDPEGWRKFGLPKGPSLEGYLFPDTYFVARPLTAEALVRRMVSRFQEVWREIGGAEAVPRTGLAEGQLVALASIVEKETGAAEERPLVASVFYNRLRAGIPLQSDPTIIYGLPNFDGNIRKGDISNPHPYNTYVHAGLPPGPICNPGRASLEAVLHPATTDYLYFVSKNDGTHQFSRTLAEHADAVRQYQLSRQ